MDLNIREILEFADCETGCYVPKDDWETFPYQAYIAEIKSIQQRINNGLGIELKRDGSVQDASFVNQLFILDNSAFIANGVIAHIYQFAIRFSNFGKLYTVYSHIEPSLEDFAVQVQNVKQIIESYGWIYVSREALMTPYDGKNSGFANQTWWIRFFDYV